MRLQRRLRQIPGRWRVVGLVVVGLAAAGLVRGWAMGRREAPPVARVERGTLAIELATLGELQAVRTQSFGVPRLRSSAAKVVWLVPEGTNVVAGDTLAVFESTEAQRRVEDLEGRLTSARANLDKLVASHAARLAEMEAALADQRAGLRLAEIAAAQVDYEARLEQEKAQLALERARLAVEQGESKLEGQRNIHAAEITEQRVTIGHLRSQLDSEREALANHVLVARSPGLVVYGSNWSGNRTTKVKVGDQIYYGGVVLELPDLSQMRVASWVNEARVDLLQVGQRCDVKVDALADSTLRGAVSRVNVLGRELPDAEGVKVFDFEVLLDGVDARLRPGMTATVVVHVDRLEDVLHGPIEAVHTGPEGPWVLRRRGRSAERVAVTVGRRNEFRVVLAAGVREGDLLVLQAPAEEDRGD